MSLIFTNNSTRFESLIHYKGLFSILTVHAEVNLVIVIFGDVRIY